MTVAVEAREAFELLMSLVAFSDGDQRQTYEIGEEWFRSAERRAGSELVGAVQSLTTGSSWVFGNLLGMALATPAPRDASGLRDQVGTADPLDVKLHLVGYHLRPFRRVTRADVMRAAAEGDAAAGREMLDTSFPEERHWRRALAGLLAADAADLRHRVLHILDAWHERVFAEDWHGWRPLLERDAAERRAAAVEADPAVVIDQATRGWDYVPEPGVSRVVLAPSVVVRPWVVTADHQETRIFCYSISDATLAAAADAPPAHLVRALRAAGDERRLRVLRRLAETPLGLHELAAEFDTGKTTIRHHLVALRAAGLVHVRDVPGREYSPHGRYVLDRDAIERIGRELEAYLRPETGRVAEPDTGRVAEPPTGEQSVRSPNRRRP